MKIKKILLLGLVLSILSADELDQLAKLTGRTELIAKLIGQMHGQISGLVYVLNSPISGFARVLNGPVT